MAWHGMTLDGLYWNQKCGWRGEARQPAQPAQTPAPVPLFGSL